MISDAFTSHGNSTVIMNEGPIVTDPQFRLLGLGLGWHKDPQFVLLGGDPDIIDADFEVKNDLPYATGGLVAGKPWRDKCVLGDFLPAGGLVGADVTRGMADNIDKAIMGAFQKAHAEHMDRIMFGIDEAVGVDALARPSELRPTVNAGHAPGASALATSCWGPMIHHLQAIPCSADPQAAILAPDCPTL